MGEPGKAEEQKISRTGPRGSSSGTPREEGTLQGTVSPEKGGEREDTGEKLSRTQDTGEKKHQLLQLR